VVGLVVAVVLLGGVAFALVSALRGSDEALLTKVPGDVDVFATAYLDPGAGQKLNLRRIAGSFPALGGPEGLDRRVAEILAEMFEPVGLRFEEDVKPWLGSQVGVALRVNRDGDPSIAVLADASDEAAAASAVERIELAGEPEVRDYRGVAIRSGTGPDGERLVSAVVEGAAVMANDEAFVEAIVDTATGGSDSLAEDDGYAAAVEPLPRSRLVVGFVDVASIIERAGVREQLAGGVPGPFAPTAGLEQLEALRGMGFTVSAEETGLSIQGAVVVDEATLPEGQRGALESEPNLDEVLAAMPRDSFVVAATSTGPIPRETVDQLDALASGVGLTSLRPGLQSLTGDLGFELGPTGGLTGFPSSPVGGTLVLGTSDAGAIRALLNDVADLVSLSLAGFGTLEPPIAPGEPGDPVGTPPPGPADWQVEEHAGTEIRFLQNPDLALSGIVPAYAVTDGFAVIGSSPEQIRQVLDAIGGDGSIADSERFDDATGRVGTDGHQLVFADVEAMLQAFGAGLPGEERENVEPIRAVAASGHSGLPTSTFHLFVVVE
jgi:hypothetical protein